MSERIEHHKNRLAAARQYLDALFDGVGERWDETLYSDGAQWTIRQLAIHLMIADKGHNNMVMGIAEGRNIIPEDYDLERFNRSSVSKRAEMTVAEIRAALAASRAELLAWLDKIDEDVLQKSGRHASLEIMTIDRILAVMAWHERTHAEDIARHLGLPAFQR